MAEVRIVEGTGSGLDDDLERLLDVHALKAGHPIIVEEMFWKATDETGKIVGGLSGKSQLGWLFVKLLGLAPAARGSGVGGKLLARAEDFARENRLAGVYLDTYEFQAPVFYVKCGYTEIGRLPAVDGHPQRIWFAKVVGEASQ